MFNLKDNTYENDNYNENQENDPTSLTNSNLRFKRRKISKKKTKMTRKKRKVINSEQNQIEANEVAITNEENIRKTLKIHSPTKLNKEFIFPNQEMLNNFLGVSNAKIKDKENINETKLKEEDDTKKLLLNAVSNIEESQKSLKNTVSKKLNKEEFEKWQKESEENSFKSVILLLYYLLLTFRQMTY